MSLLRTGLLRNSVLLGSQKGRHSDGIPLTKMAQENGDSTPPSAKNADGVMVSTRSLDPLYEESPAIGSDRRRVSQPAAGGWSMQSQYQQLHEPQSQSSTAEAEKPSNDADNVLEWKSARVSVTVGLVQP